MIWLCACKKSYSCTESPQSSWTSIFNSTNWHTHAHSLCTYILANMSVHICVFMYIKLQCLCNSRAFRFFLSVLLFAFIFWIASAALVLWCYCLFRFDCIRFCSLSVSVPVPVCCPMFAVRCRLLLLRPWPLTYIEMSANRFSGSPRFDCLFCYNYPIRIESQMVIWLLNDTHKRVCSLIQFSFLFFFGISCIQS